MSTDQAYMAAFLITGSHIDAELARTRQRAKLAVCQICGDNIEAGDTVDLYQRRNAHRDCVELAQRSATQTVDCGNGYTAGRTIMLHGVPDTTVKYIACFVSMWDIIQIVPFDQGGTKAEALETIRKFAPRYEAGTRFVLKRVETQYLEWFEDEES